jgi:hypothetical protein
LGQLETFPYRRFRCARKARCWWSAPRVGVGGVSFTPFFLTSRLIYQGRSQGRCDFTQSMRSSAGNVGRFC